MKILILGGYGTFGGRLVRLLAHEPRLELVLAGRSSARAVQFIKGHAIAGGATLESMVLDRGGDIDSALERLRPEALVDASGPFQAYGDDAYRVVEACLRHRVNYLDLADGTGFVAGIAGHDEHARKQGIFAISGVSTVPALSFAVVRHLSSGCGVRIEPRAIAVGIAPSPYAGVGLNVIRAILSYAGKPLVGRANRGEVRGIALVDSMRFAIAPPGGVPLGNRRFSLVDVPDLRLAAGAWPHLESIWVGAAPMPPLLHRCLSAMALLVRWRVVASLSSLARMAHWSCEHIRWGEARGGMFVRIMGSTAAGRNVERAWHLAAEGDDGPYIPSMGVAALLQRMLGGRGPAAGARPCTDDLELADYAPFFDARRIRHGVRDDGAVADQGLYRRVLASAWPLLAPAIRRLHGGGDCHELHGEVDIERGHGIAGMLAALAGFPRAGARLPLRVVMRERSGGETWERSFGATSVQSRQWQGRGGAEGLLCERLGPIGLAMALVTEGDKLHFVLRDWSLLALPMPRFLAPTLRSWEEADGEHVRFHVEIGHPFTGMIVRYCGWHATAVATPCTQPAEINPA